MTTNDKVTVDINAAGTDGDYLTFYEYPAKGRLSHTNIAEKIPTANGMSVRLEYTPASSTPESDTRGDPMAWGWRASGQAPQS